MKAEDLEEILLTIAYREEDSQKAESSFNILYREYSKLLYSVVRKNLSNIGVHDEQILDAVINNTFINIYENPLKFAFTDPLVKTDGTFKAWIITIAKNELFDLLNEYKPLNVKSNDDKIEPAFQETYLDLDDTVDISKINTLILEEALKTLSERDREILRSLYMYHEEGRNTPSEVLDELCSFFGTTRANIRKVKERAEKKIIEYFSKHTQLKPLKYAKG